jgi:hypothetical protein
MFIVVTARLFVGHLSFGQMFVGTMNFDQMVLNHLTELN